MKSWRLAILATVLVLACGVARPQEAENADQTETASPAAASVVVLLPERIEQDWYWYFFSTEAQHVVQSAVEKSLIGAGINVLDISSRPPSAGMDALLAPDQARALAQQMGAEYMIWGKAIADKKSEGEAYGVRVVRVTATVTARLIRVSDGRVLASEEATAEEGGQALRAAAREALKKAGGQIARKMAKAVAAALQPPS